ncbi:MAG: hypothetical protein AABY22_07760 [Nanoarchaeota archaeon]
MKDKICFVYSDQGDWVAIYINGSLVKESHSFEPRDILKILNIDFEEKSIDTESSKFNGFTSKLDKLNF